MWGAPALPTMKRCGWPRSPPNLGWFCCVHIGVRNPQSKHSPVHSPSNTSTRNTPASWHSTEPVQGFLYTSCLILQFGEGEGRKDTKKMQRLSTQPCPRAEEKVESSHHLGSSNCALVLGG